jgi:hypothetical protein
MDKIKAQNFILPFIFAAIPAGYLPFSYLFMVVWFLLGVIIGYDITPSNGSFSWWILSLGLWGTFVQWPIYALWILLSKDITLRLKVGWILLLIFLNMFAIPYFLYCKYKQNTGPGFIKLFGNRRFKRYLEQKV